MILIYMIIYWVHLYPLSFMITRTAHDSDKWSHEYSTGLLPWVEASGRNNYKKDIL